MNKLVRGIGVYERGLYQSTVDKIHTREYVIWKGILNRCQVDGVHQSNHKSYIGCTVHPDFIKFQDFAAWCNQQIGFEQLQWHLDKDILVPGNKVYGPDTCCFVPQEINKLLIHHRKNQGDCPVGVTTNQRDGKFVASIRIDGLPQYLGRYDTATDAYKAYRSAKINNIRNKAEMWKSKIDNRVYQALLNYQMDGIISNALQQPDTEAN